MGLVDGPNTYSYVHNNPINAYDPTGETTVVLTRTFGVTYRVGSYGYRSYTAANGGISFGSQLYDWMHSEEWSDGDNHWIENEILDEPVIGGQGNCDENRRKKAVMERALERQMQNRSSGRARQGRGFSNQAQERSHRARIERIRNKIRELDQALEMCEDEEEECG